MKKRKFLIPLTVLATSMVTDAALANIPDAPSSVKDSAQMSLLSSNKANTGIGHDFVLNRSMQSIIQLAAHTSHASHASHYSSSSSSSGSSQTLQPSQPSQPSHSSHVSHHSHLSHASHNSHYSGR